MIQVTLLSMHDDPIRALYMAYRVCYSKLTPQSILARIEKDRITHEQMLEFVKEKLETGHVSPLEQVWFEFGISGVSRAFSHQFVRTRVGFSPEQQSQRYVVYDDGKFEYSTPATIDARPRLHERYRWLMREIASFYDDAVKEGVPGEDARFVLPNATNTNLKVTLNFAALLHMADLRLCTRAQWEYRKTVALMRSEIKKKWPVLAEQMQPKCGDKRLGYCDESMEAYLACPLGKVRPHKKTLQEAFLDARKPTRVIVPLDEELVSWATEYEEPR